MFLHDYYSVVAQLKRLHDDDDAAAVADRHTYAEESERVRFILSRSTPYGL